jgi:hypothetical protein
VFGECSQDSLGQHNLGQLMKKLFVMKLVPGKAKQLRVSFRQRPWSSLLIIQAIPVLTIAVLLFAAPPALQSRVKDKVSYGDGLIINVPFPESEVEQVVQEVTQNGIIRGTKEYNKDEYVKGALAADSTRVFPPWTEGGKVYYKVRLQALDPRNFKDSGDLGTLAVRYVLQPQGDKNTVLRINAVFVEDFRKIVHASNGSVESSEYKDIHDHLDAIGVMKEQTVEAENERQELLQKKQLQAANGAVAPAATPVATASVAAAPGYSSSVPSGRVASAPVASVAPAPVVSAPVASAPPASNPPVTTVAVQPSTSTDISTQQTSGQTLEQHLQDLRRQVERLVKAPGAPLKSAPFHTASTLNPLQPGTEVLILISTPYWYGVETREGQHGWISRDELESLP